MREHMTRTMPARRSPPTSRSYRRLLASKRQLPIRIGKSGNLGFANTVVIFDIGTINVDAFPTADRWGHARLSLHEIIGPRQYVASFKCDGSREFYSAAVELGQCLDISPPSPMHRSRTQLLINESDTPSNVATRVEMLLHRHSRHRIRW